MASSSSSRLFACLFVLLWSGRLYANECYPSIISLGDSIADTGNQKQLASISDVEFICGPPYGQNFIDQTTGRCSNGRLIIDFLAESLGLPLVPPYFKINESGDVPELGRQGVNYAVVGATALDSSYIEATWSESSVINASIRIQLAWFKESMPSLCGNTSDCRNFIGRSLVLMGEIGGNDYNYPLSAGKPIDEIKPIVPLVIDTIISTVNELILMGARTLVVPGNFPIGCFPKILTIYGPSDSEEYDPITGCITKFNELAEYHNKMLQTKLNHVRKLNPDVAVIYADYYNALMQIYRSPYEYGFTNDKILKACCGCGGSFNFNNSMICGDLCTTVCDEVDTYVSWDGIHLTERAYKLLFKSLFQGPFTIPEFHPMCPTATSIVGVGLSSYM